MSKKDAKLGIAIAALIVNLILPGLGSIIARRTKEGTIQLVLTIISFPLMIILIGIPLYIGMWIWALVTSINLLQKAN